MVARSVCRLGLIAGLVLLSGAPVLADPPDALVPRPGREGERPSAHYASMLASEAPALLTALAQSSDRVRVSQMGRSAGGRPLLLAIVSSPENLSRLDEVLAMRRAMLSAAPMESGAPATAYTLPAIAFISAGSRGNVYPGTDAAMALLRTLATDGSEATLRILDAVIVVMNVMPNPDGRALGGPGNAAGMDLARDIVAQSQPETRAVVESLAAWSPMLFLDVSGYADTLVLRAAPPPTQAPIGDLYRAWSLDLAHAMSGAIFDASGYAPETTLQSSATDWPWFDLATYASYHGALGLTVEVSSRDGGAVASLEAAMQAALAYVAKHRAVLVRDQARLLSGGLLRGSRESAFGAEPTTYLIPTDRERQSDRHEAAALVDLLIRNGISVERALAASSADGREIAPDDYLVRLDQPKGALAAALLWAPGDEGEASAQRMASGWSLPLAWGVTRWPLAHSPEVDSEPVEAAPAPEGVVWPGEATAYACPTTNNATVVAANALLRQGVPVQRSARSWVDGDRTFPAGTLVLSGDAASRESATAIAERYGLELFPLSDVPPDAVELHPLRIGVHADPSVAHVLRDLGFDVTALSTEALSTGSPLALYDVIVVSGSAPLWSRLSKAGRQALWAYARDGGSLIGIGCAGADLAVSLGLADLDQTVTSLNYAGMARIVGDPDDPITSSYREGASVCVRAPVWYTFVADNVQVAATYSPAGPLLTGYWPLWEDVNPTGQPTIVRLPGAGSTVTLFGFDPTEGAFPRATYRFLAQAIYDSPSRASR